MRTDYQPAIARQIMLREAAAITGHALLTPLALLPSRHRPLRRRELRTLVFVHGLAATPACFAPMQLYLRARGYPRQLAFAHRSGPSIEALAIQLARRLKSEVKGGRIDLITHSLGGLIARVYLQQLGGDRRVDRLITLGTPHAGSYAALWAPSAFVRQLDPEGPFIRHLATLPPPRVTCLSVVGGSDAMVLPRESAACPFGEIRRFARMGHTGMLLSPQVFRAVDAALAAPLPR